MKKKFVAAALTLGLAFGGFSGVADARPAKPAKPNTTCMQFGIGVLQSTGALPSVAKGGLEYPIGSGNVIPFSGVLAVHRDNPALANEVLKAYAPVLGLTVTPELVAAVDSACPTS